MPTGFTLTDFVVVESLATGEPTTGQATYEMLSALLAENEPGLRARIERPQSSGDFARLLHALEEEARASATCPLIHIECHGDQTTGLWFADKSSLGWEAFSSLLTRINVATEFNLVVVVSACYGAYLGGQFSVLAPAPAFAIVAPTDGIYPDELLRGFREFYRVLILEGDAGKATRALSRLTLDQGSWFSDLAETWYERIVMNYAEKNLSPRALHDWARDLSRRHRAEGHRASVGSTYRALRARHRREIAGKYFERFFSTAEVPSSAQRFGPVRLRIARKLAELKARGKIAI